MHRIGVIGVQGDVEEHLSQLKIASKEMEMNTEMVWVREKEGLTGCEGVVIPGGESTTISRLIDKFELRDGIEKVIENGGAVMGTCAGCIILAKEGDITIQRKKIKLLGLINISVERNVYGRQRESFEAPISIKLPPQGDFEGWQGDYPGVFIRAPRIRRIGEGVDILAKLDNEVVMVQQKNIIALTFHPELTENTLIHRYFLSLI